MPDPRDSRSVWWAEPTRSDDWTSYGIQWCRAATRPRPDFDLSPQSMLYRTLAGDPLFTVVSHGGVPSEGIFTLIAEAPRMRDEIDAEQRKENVYMEQLEAIVKHIAGMVDPVNLGNEYGLVHRTLIYDARSVLGGP